jgi:hypothetical protein
MRAARSGGAAIIELAESPFVDSAEVGIVRARYAFHAPAFFPPSKSALQMGRNCSVLLSTRGFDPTARTD